MSRMEDYQKIRELLKNGLTYREIQRQIHYPLATIHDIKAADDLSRLSFTQDFEEALRQARRIRKAATGLKTTNLTADIVAKMVSLKLEGLSYERIAKELGLASHVVRVIIGEVIWGLNQVSMVIGPTSVKNYPEQRFVRFEGISIFPQDPQELRQAVEDIRGIDAGSLNKDEFKQVCTGLIDSYNKRLLKYRIRFWLRNGSPFERGPKNGKAPRPFAIRVRRSS